MHQIKRFSQAMDAECYKVFADEMKQLFIKNVEEEKIYNLEAIIDNLKSDTILQNRG